MLKKLEDGTSPSRRSRGLLAFTSDPRFRTGLMGVTPFWVMGVVGAILEYEVDYLVKLGLFAVMYIVLSLLGNFVFDDRIISILPIAIYFATKAWFYYTWLVHVAPYAGFLTTLLYLSLSAVLWYNFLKAWRGDPGIIRTSEKERYRTIIELAERDGFDQRVFCSTCLIKKPLRSKHCSMCDVCVSREGRKKGRTGGFQG